MSFEEIERQRSAREELERIEVGLSQRLHKTPEILAGGHRSRRIGALTTLEAKSLLDKYETVYSTLEKVKYTRLSNEEALVAYNEPVAEIPSVDRYGLLSGGLDQYRCEYTKDLNVDQMFTPSENYGQFFDLHPHYAKYVAAKDISMSYIDYLMNFPIMDASEEYTRSVDEYLRDFFSRAFPFEDELEIEIADPLFCATCQRHFTTQGVFDGHLNGKKHKRAASGGKPQPDNRFLIKRIQKYVEFMAGVLGQTITDVKRQSFLTEKERKAEVESLALAIQREDEDITSTSALATMMQTATREKLGPDGKPIPQWLYKLKGLGQEFTCEVCGNYVYNGRQAFDRHFDEMRHTHGLKCLGVDAQAVYRGITDIEDVLKLAGKQKNVREDAEVEDDEGNVMTERVYRDLKNQGLI